MSVHPFIPFEDIQQRKFLRESNSDRVTLVNTSGNETGVQENLFNIVSPSHMCLDNSTSITLSASGVFQGSFQNSLDFTEIIVSVSTDQNSATDGLVIEWSADGVTVDETDEFSILANRGKTFSFPCNRQYMRIKYTNGTTNQTIFNLATYFKRFASKGSSHRIKDSIVGDDDAILSKALLTGHDDTGIFKNVGVSTSNRLKVNSQPYTFAVAEGDVLNHTGLLKFGTRMVVAANTDSVIWEGTSALYTYLTSAERLKISSTSANDTSNGTGIRTLTIEGLDANFIEQTETVTMSGLTIVTTANSYIRIFRAYGATCGTLYTNSGIINITNNGGTTQLLSIPAGDSQTLMTIWTVPAGKTLYLTNSSFSTDSNKGARVSIMTRSLDGGILYPWRIRYRAFIFSGNENFPFTIPFKLTEKTDIEVRILTPTTAGNTECGATFEGWYESN
jgi:hypothetical protein